MRKRISQILYLVSAGTSFLATTLQNVKTGVIFTVIGVAILFAIAGLGIEKCACRSAKPTSANTKINHYYYSKTKRGNQA